MPNNYVPPTLVQLLDCFGEEVERRRRQLQQKGGQQVPPGGDFVSCPPSALERLDWWLREFRAARERDLGERDGAKLAEAVRAWNEAECEDRAGSTEYNAMLCALGDWDALGAKGVTRG